MTSSRNVDLVDSIAAALSKLNSTSMLLSNVVVSADDQLQEEGDVLQDVLRELGVVNPHHALERIPEAVEEVTNWRVEMMLSELEFESGHAALEAQERIHDVMPPLKRVVRAARINRAVVLASIQSSHCRNWIAGAMFDWQRGD